MRRAFRISARLGLLALAVAMLASCVRTPGADLAQADKTLARDRWERFTATAARTENIAGPFRLNATLYYSGKEDSQRVTVYFWGNGKKDAPLPLRLDILMGPGSVMASAREDSRGLFIYVPREELVYHAKEQGFVAFGVPLPFTLEDLASLVCGRFATVFAPATDAVPPAGVGENGVFTYTVPDARLAGLLSLAEDGLPVAWTNDTEAGWQLSIEYWPDSTRTTPRKLYIRHPDGKEATLIVRELAAPDAPFSAKQLELAVPPNTRLAPLEEAR